MTHQQPHLPRRGFCMCCIAAGAFAATGGWLSPRAAYAEARGLVSLIKDSAATSPIMTHRLRNNISVLEGSGGNVAVLTGPADDAELKRPNFQPTPNFIIEQRKSGS